MDGRTQRRPGPSTPRHARTSGPAAPQHTSLSIRSAERRRWAGDLTQPGETALVIHGLGGVGKSTLAAQIAARVSRLAPERVVTVVSGEVSAASLAGPHPNRLARTDIRGYREFYAALNLLLLFNRESICPAQFGLRVDHGSRTIATAHTG